MSPEHLPDTLFGISLSRLEALCAQHSMPGFRAKQIADWLYKKNVTGIDEMSNLSRAERVALSETHIIGRVEPLRVQTSNDGTKKYLFEAGGGAFIECAYIPEADRATLCVSSQAGCKMGCRFCATGTMGLCRNLSAGQILNQLFSIPEFETVTNIVYMGMGEPMDNIDEVLRSLEVLTADWGLAWSPKRITVSTIGVIEGLRRFLSESSCHLAVSLHNPFEDERSAFMPAQKRNPLADIMALLRSQDWSGQRRLSFEYIMFDTINDTQKHAAALVRLLSGFKCRVNLIGYHEIPGAKTPFRPSPRPVMEAFQSRLNKAGFRTTIRKSRGQDIEAACGLLSAREQSII